MGWAGGGGGGGAGLSSGCSGRAGGSGVVAGSGGAAAAGSSFAPPNLAATSPKSFISMYAVFFSSTIWAMTGSSLGSFTRSSSSLLSFWVLLTVNTIVFCLEVSIWHFRSCFPYTKVSFILFWACLSITFSEFTHNMRGMLWELFMLYTSTLNSFLGRVFFDFLLPPNILPRRPAFFAFSFVFGVEGPLEGA